MATPARAGIALFPLHSTANRPMRIGAILLCTFMWALMPARAQVPGCDLVLHGHVVDEHDHGALGFAHVVIVGTGRSTATDVDGRFRFDGMCPGRHVLRFSHVGCVTRERAVELTGDTTVVLHLEHHVLEFSEVEVVAARPDEHVGQAHAEVAKDMMERKGGSGLAEMIDHVPGVSVLRSGPTIGKPIIHGLSGNRVLTLNQGVRQEDQQWGTDHAPSLDPLGSDRITVVKGAASVQYGADAIGGVVLVEPVQLPVRAGMGGELRATGSTNGRGGGGNGHLQGGVKGIDGLGWRVQGSGRYLGDQQAPDYVLSNTGLREAGGSAAIGWRNPKQGVQLYYSLFDRELGILRAAHIGNLSDLQDAIASGRPWYTAPFGHRLDAPRQHVRHQLAKAEARRFLSERDLLVFTYALQLDERREFDMRRGGRSHIPALHLRLRTHTGDLVLNHYLSDRMHGKLGVGGTHQENVNVPGTGVRPLIPNYRKRTAGLYLIEHLDLSERIELEAGARVEGTLLDVFTYTAVQEFITPHHSFLNHALSAGLNWSVRDSVRLRTHISSAFRPPHVSELYSEGLHHGSAAIEVGDATLGSERALKATVDLEAFALAGALRMDLTLHASRIDQFIQLRPEGHRLTIRGAFPEFRHAATDVWMHGLDLSAEWAFMPRLAVRSRYSMVRARDLAADTWLFQMPADRMENSLVFRADRAGSWRGIELAVSSTEVWRQRRVPPGLDFMPPPDAYRLIGLSASIARPIGEGELRIGIEGHNLLNTAYRDYLDRFRYYADARAIDVALWLRYAFGRT